MKITRSAKHHVSMGNFEWIEFGAEVTLDSDEFPDGVSLDLLEATAVSYLADALADDVEEARRNTDVPNSYIHLFQNDDQENT